MHTLPMTSQAPDEIREQLDAGESLLWHARPRQGLVLRAWDAWFIPFSLLWCGITLRNLNLAPMMAHSGPARLHALLFMGIGLYLLVGRFVLDAWRRSRTVYALTQQRAIIVSGIAARSVRSVSLRNLSELNLSLRSAGVGTIVFGPLENGLYAARDGAVPTVGIPLSPRFELIANAKAVYELIRQEQRRQPGQP